MSKIFNSGFNRELLVDSLPQPGDKRLQNEEY